MTKSRKQPARLGKKDSTLQKPVGEDMIVPENAEEKV